MIGDEYICVEGDGIYVQRLEEETKECFPVFIVPEYVPSVITAEYDRKTASGKCMLGFSCLRIYPRK
jgi:hypothetical protein